MELYQWKPMVHYQSALVLEERSWKQEGEKIPRWEMNLCISPGKMHFSHLSNSLAYGKKIVLSSCYAERKNKFKMEK